MPHAAEPGEIQPDAREPTIRLEEVSKNVQELLSTSGTFGIIFMPQARAEALFAMKGLIDDVHDRRHLSQVLCHYLPIRTVYYARFPDTSH